MTQKQKDVEEFTSMLHYVADCIRYAHQIQSLNNCNTCTKKECKYRPKLGQLARINCFDWEDKTDDIIRSIKTLEP